MTRIPALLVALAFSTSVSADAVAQAPRDVSQRVRPDLCPGEYFDMHPVRDVTFSGVFATAEAAVDAVARLDDRTFDIEVREAAVGYDWVANARYKALPAPAAFASHRATLEPMGLMPGCDGFAYTSR